MRERRPRTRPCALVSIASSSQALPLPLETLQLQPLVNALHAQRLAGVDGALEVCALNDDEDLVEVEEADEAEDVEERKGEDWRDENGASDEKAERQPRRRPTPPSSAAERCS